MKTFLPLLLISLFSLILHATGPEVEHLIITYMGDPSTSMTANWQWIGDAAETAGLEARVVYDTVSRGADAGAYAFQARGDVFGIEGLDDRVVARVNLEDLKPGSTYFLRVGDATGELSDEIKARTIPDGDDPLRFVTGGDMGTSEAVRTLLKHAAEYEPAFAAVGGDIAYANGKLSSVNNWDVFLKMYTDEMVTPQGYTIPVVFSIGNHEVRGGYNKTKDDAPFFFGFFGQDPDKSYFKRQFGRNFVMLVLDSGHVATHESQADFIRKELTASASVKYKTAIYHVPLYPSHRNFMGHYSELGREHWAPLFDEGGLAVAFENHDHTYKRSHHIFAGKVAKEGKGTLYLGDGCWGRNERPISYESPWYIAKQGSLQHFWVVDVTPERMEYQAVDIKNRVFDRYPEDATRADEVDAVFKSYAMSYKVPWGFMESSLDLSQEEIWKGGKVNASFTNPFEHPMKVWIQPQSANDRFQAEPVSTDPVTIQAGETLNYPVTWTSKEPSGVEVKDVHLGFNLLAHLEDPEKKEPTKFSGKLWVNITRPESAD